MKFYLTFPQRLPTRNCYQVIEADNQFDARRIAVAEHGSAWAFLYTEEAFAGQVEKYGLTELTA